MTKQEAFDFLLGKKVLCLNQSETIKVQKKLFEIGYMWSEEEEQEPRIDYFAIFMKRKDLTMTSDINHWVKDESEKIEVSEILSIEIEKPKFNPKDLKPFDKVLVRDYKYDFWRARFYDYCKDGEYGTTDGGWRWRYCIPFNDETKHLHNTKIEEPEFYQI